MTHTDQNLELILFDWVDALRRRDPVRIAGRLAEDIIWQGLRRDLVCPNREAVLHNIAGGGQHREHVTGIEVAALDDQHVLLGVQVPGVTEFFGETLDGAIFDVFTIDGGVITRIDEFKTREDALTHARKIASAAESGQGRRAPRAPAPPPPPRVERVVPILNVSDIHESFAWFEKLGWRNGFEWKADPSDDRPGFGSVKAASCEIFLCRDGQAAAAAAPTSEPSGPTATRRPTRAPGCRSGSTTSTRSTSAASPKASTSPIRRPTSRGECANATSDIPTDTCSASARVSEQRARPPRSARGPLADPIALPLSPQLQPGGGGESPGAGVAPNRRRTPASTAA